MCSYLDKVGSTYYFRRMVPLELRPFLRTKTGKPRSEIKVSLGTKDRAEAKHILPDHVKASERTFAEARAILTQSASEPRREPNAAQTENDAARVEWEAQNDAYWEAARAKEEFEFDARAEQRRVLESGEIVEGALLSDYVLAQQDLMRHEQFERQVAEERLAWHKLAANSSDNPTTNETDRVGVLEHPAPIEVSIQSLFDKYVATRQPSPSTTQQWQSCIQHLVDFLGHDNAGRVIPEDLVKWRNKLSSVSRQNGKPLSAKTVNGSYLAAANVVFTHGVDNLVLKQNPAKDVARVKGPRRTKVREKDFTRDEQQLILEATFGEASGKISETNALARRWVPWICAYTGARVNEITQVRAEDISRVDDVWTLHITPEAGRLKTYTARRVPLHEHLLEQGILDLIRDRTGPIFYDPTKQRVAKPKRPMSIKTGMHLASWVREIGVNHPGVAPNHGWRHTFRTVAREAGLAEAMIDAIDGHVPSNEGGKYGTFSIAVLAKAITAFPRYPIRDDGRRAL